jgi:hypothetical protein
MAAWLWVDRPCNHRLLVARDVTNLGTSHFPSLTVKYSGAVETLALISAALLTTRLLIMKYPLMPSRYLNCLVWAKLRFKIYDLPHTPDSQKHLGELYCFLKNVVFWAVAPCRSCVNRVSGERITSIFMVEKSSSEEPIWAGGCRLVLAFSYC